MTMSEKVSLRTMTMSEYAVVVAVPLATVLDSSACGVDTAVGVVGVDVEAGVVIVVGTFVVVVVVDTGTL